MLFQSVSDTLIEFGENPRWLGGAIAATLVLHTWGQTLSQHLHIHALVAAGALAPDGHWITSRRGFLFPVTALSPVFRGKFLARLKQLFCAGTLKLAASSAPLADATAQRRLFNTLYEKPWVVYAKRPFAGPAQVLDYLGRYTHRVAISNHRLVSYHDTEVRFRYQDYAHGKPRRVMTLTPAEFIRRFLLHVLPARFMRIRHYGILANRAKREKLAAARTALDSPPAPQPPEPESVATFWLRVACLDIHQCPHCKAGRIIVIGPIPVPYRLCRRCEHLDCPRTASVRRPLAPLRPHSCRPPPLTLECASVIVISSTDQPSRSHEDVHALPQSIDRRNQQRPSARRHHYNLQSTAL